MFSFIPGRLGKDAEVIETSGGTKCVKFTVAENIYRNGENKTLWYDVISYDSFVANSQIKALKKGTFVVVAGDVDCNFNVGKNGKIYLNYNLTASTIKIPNISGGKGTEGEASEPTIGVSVGKFEEPVEMTPTVDEKPKKKATTKTTVVEEPQPLTLNEDDGDDLPF